MLSLNVLFWPQPEDIHRGLKKPENIHIYQAGIRECLLLFFLLEPFNQKSWSLIYFISWQLIDLSLEL